MKRYFTISFNLILGSIIPILCWFFIGIILDKNLINVFSITYPLQFLYLILVHIFGSGANICKEKDNNEKIVMSSFIIGSLVTILIFGLFVINVNSFLLFMGYDSSYKIFTIYSIILLAISVIFYIMIENLYFEDREKEAFKYCLIFNLLILIVLILSALITKSQIVSVVITLSIICLYTLFIIIKLFRKSKFTFNLLNCLKYESSTICSDILFLFIFLFGLKNANSFGIEYISAINFVALITDTQWDALSSVTTIAKIDISKERFNYKEHLKKSYLLTFVLVLSSIFMMFIFYKIYNLNLKLILAYFSIEVFNFSIWSKYATDNIIVQLNISSVKATTVKFITNTIRFFLSLLPTPFCTAIGQGISSLLQFICFNAIKIKDTKKRDNI